MIDPQNREIRPTLDEIGAYIRNPLFQNLCSRLQTDYRCKEKIEFSACSWEPGWNVKFRKSGKTLCTIYPRESFFRIMVVIGQKKRSHLRSSRRLQQTAQRYLSGNPGRERAEMADDRLGRPGRSLR